MEELRGKWLLIDTNLLIKMLQYLNDGLFDVFLKQLEEFNIRSVVEESTLFEFRRGSRTQSDLDIKNSFLDYLLGGNRITLSRSRSKEIVQNAEELAILYSSKNAALSKQISFVDCLVGAQLIKYKKNLFLATLDNNDYPLFIFDRMKLVTLDAEKEILNIGLYAFNQEKYSACRKNFPKGKRDLS